MECSNEIEVSNNSNFKDFFNCHYSEKYNKKVLLVRYCFFVKQKTYEDLIKYCFNIVDENKTPNSINEFIFYIDLANVKMKQVDMNLIKSLIKELEDRYPDLSEKIFIANIPVFFKICYSIIKGLIHKDTRNKIFFEKKKKNIGSEYTNNIDDIL
jgi:hypothetical protein